MHMHTGTARPTTTQPLEPPVTAQERRLTLFTAGVWLIFFVWTIIGFVNSSAPLPLQVAGWVALAVFPIVYLPAFLYPEPIPKFTRHGNSVVYSLVLIGLGIIMSLSAPIALINVVPYLMAVWIFNHRLPTAFTATVIFFAATVALALVADYTDAGNWFLPAVGAPTVIMIFVRISMEMGFQQQHRAEQLALAHQREELASTVHDVLGHSLTAITVKVQLAQRLFDTDPRAARTELADIETLARSSLSEVRATVTDLQHPDLAEQLQQAETTLRAAQLAFHRPADLPRLTLVQQQVFAWVIREAVTNVIRHAHATTCTVTISKLTDRVILQIDDDGVGILDPEGADHHGLAGLRRRVTTAGGTLELSRLAPGTRVEVKL